MPKPYDHDYPPAAWTADGVADALRSTTASYPLPTFDDGDAWAAFRADPATRPVVDTVLEEAAAALDTPIPAYPASLYLEYVRGENVSQRAVMRPSLERARRLSVVALAECLERDGRFEDAILDHAWALCEQTTWLHPANLAEAEDLEGLPTDAPPEERNVALRPAGFAKLLAQVDHVLGERLHPALRERIRREVEERVLAPYEAREDMWWMEGPSSNNWNAVCNAGPAIAALHLLEDPDRQGRLLAKAARNLRYYLAAFDRDGSTPEGVGYWNYGFGNYVQLAAHLESRTGGAYSLLSPPIVREIARFPLRVELSPGRYPAFSDASERTAVDPFTACWLGHRFDDPGLAARGRAALGEDAVGYPEAASVRSLRRTFTLDREASALTVEDRATLADDAPGTDLESVLVSYAPLEATDDGLSVTAERAAATITIDADGWTVERLPGAIDKSETDRFEADRPDVWRARIAAVDGATRATIAPRR